ncbi:MAG: hypothetical protein HG424_002970 [candidate division SR1 bacterium]|nr:hypothetical protein [candidate division SR1 bacterium]
MELTIKITSPAMREFDVQIKAEGSSADISMAVVQGLSDAIANILNKLKGSTKEAREFTVNALIRELKAKVLGISDPKSDLDVLLGGLQGILEQITKRK